MGEKVEHEVVGKDLEDARRRSIRAAHGDRALDYIGDDRVELTDEDVSYKAHCSIATDRTYRTRASVGRPIE